MSNQLQITGGAKVRNLEGVLTGTSGVVSSLGINVPSGIPQLDGSGKILVSQLPNSVMEYKGTWSAATNTPTLANGTGNAGDVYLCDAAGTVNFGAGPITFAVGDQVLYSGTIWQKASGATGTVTSVALTESGDALTITGSPITTSGTINIGFAGTSTQYIAGNGTLVTFPSIISEAQNLVTEVYNSTGATIAKGSVVYINGGQGNLPTITKAQADTEVASNQTIGLVRADITNMNNGYVTVAGRLENLDTQAYSVGTTLYLSPSVAGGYTSTKPTSPDHIVYVGIIVRSHPTQGVIEVKIQNTQELSESSDVLITSPANNEGLFYDGTTSLWKNKTIANVLGYTPANDALVVHLAGTETITGAKTFSSVITGDAGIILKEGVIPSLVGYTGLAGDADGLVITKRVGATAYTNLLSFTGSTSNTYSFPNLSGTIALLSATQTFTGDNTFNGDAIFTSQYVKLDGAGPSSGNTLNIKQFSSNLVRGVGYSSIGAIGNTKFTFYLGNTTAFDSRQFNLDGVNLTVNTPRTYTLPDLSGTLALLEGTQTFTGLKSFDAALNLKVGAGAGGTGYIGLGSITDNTLVVYNTTAGTTYSQSLAFPNGAGNTYTFPNASGTIALTSNLSSYVPYTGATADVDLGTRYFKATGVQTESAFALKILTAGIAFQNGYSVMSSLAGTFSITQAVSAGNLKSMTFDFSAWATNSSYTYTLPAANGTLALTSNLSSYVPYTGATTNVNLGLYDLTGNYINGKQLTVNKNGTTGGALFIESGSAGFGFGGTSGIAIASGSTNNLTLAFTDATATNTKAAILNFGSLTNNTNRTYTLPDISGTLALLEGTQTFTGAKTFSTINVTNASTLDGNLLLKKAGIAVTTSTYVTQFAASSGVGIGYSDGTGGANFTFQTASIYTYTFPASTGTLVLGTGTTNYLPKFTGASTLGNSLIFDNGTNVGIGNTNTTYTFDVTGTGRFTGSLNGTSATFSSNLTTNSTFFVQNTDYNSGTATGTNFRIFLNASSGNTYTRLQTYTDGGATYGNLVINPLGGNVGIGPSNPTFIFDVETSNLTVGRFYSNATGKRNNILIQNSQNFNYGVFGVVSGNGTAGGDVYGLGYSASGSTAFTNVINWTSGGNVGIGTNTPSRALEILNTSTQLRLSYDATTYSEIRSDSSAGLLISAGNSYIINYTNGTERMRIFASGNVRFSSQVYGNTVASPRTLYIASDGELGGISSIRESKTNIAELDSNWLMQLNPVSFNYRKKDEDGKYTDEYYDELFYGLIAEETELVNKEICTYNDDKLVGIEYSKLVPVLVKAIQELSAKVSELENKS